MRAVRKDTLSYASNEESTQAGQNHHVVDSVSGNVGPINLRKYTLSVDPDNLFLTHQKILSITQENKYLGKCSYFFMN